MHVVLTTIRFCDFQSRMSYIIFFLLYLNARFFYQYLDQWRVIDRHCQVWPAVPLLVRNSPFHDWQMWLGLKEVYKSITILHRANQLVPSIDKYRKFYLTLLLNIIIITLMLTLRLRLMCVRPGYFILLLSKLSSFLCYNLWWFSPQE